MPGGNVENSSNDYLWDVFLSYPHQKDHQDWVRNVFLDDLQLFLTQELGRPPHIFIDRKGIETGDAWPQRVQQALSRARVLLSVFSINYFLSDWCMAECYVMLYREQQLGYRTQKKPEGLLVPLRLFDGDRYPPFARKIQAHDYTEFNIITGDFKNTPQYLNLRKVVKEWAVQVAKVIENAPEWKPEFESQIWLSDQVGKWIHDPDFQFPHKPFRAPTIGGK